MKNNITVLSLSKTNCYLIKADKGYLLIDCGYDYDKKIFLSRLNKNYIDIGDINYLFLTHHHDDHSGLTNYLTSMNKNLIVIAHKHAKDLLIKGENDKSRGGGFLNKRISFLTSFYKRFHPNWTLKFPPFKSRKQDIFIENDDNTLLRQFGISGTILYTPGHSIDSMSILMDNGELFAGDATMNWLKWAGTKYATMFITDIHSYYKSWEKIISYDAKVIYPAHGKPFNVDKMKKNIWTINQEQLVSFF